MRMSTEQIQEKIEANWPRNALSLYFAQVLSGECSIQDTLVDLLSHERRAK